jgi:hypothetical protein
MGYVNPDDCLRAGSVVLMAGGKGRCFVIVLAARQNQCPC